MIGKKRMRNAAKDIYYLREAFGSVCPELRIKNEKISRKGKKRSSIKACRRIEASYFGGYGQPTWRLRSRTM
ncbi:MAG: hypothetical protein A4E57_03782 [Syntrophorhabdaceae bacterium PtaU1.Bin034]|jgi:cell division GTPase FtsZ|nr:MAG: hypothetical protein A4E57_03782 [Syntrophorhabdaceae bacterium PtaU1.Bin034]